MADRQTSVKACTSAGKGSMGVRVPAGGPLRGIARDEGDAVAFMFGRGRRIGHFT